MAPVRGGVGETELLEPPAHPAAHLAAHTAEAAPAQPEARERPLQQRDAFVVGHPAAQDRRRRATTRHDVPVGRWPSTPAELVAVQKALAREAPEPWAPRPGMRVGGCFVCSPRGSAGAGPAHDRGWAAAAVDGEAADVEGEAGARRTSRPARAARWTVGVTHRPCSHGAPGPPTCVARRARSSSTATPSGAGCARGPARGRSPCTPRGAPTRQPRLVWCWRRQCGRGCPDRSGSSP